VRIPMNTMKALLVMINVNAACCSTTENHTDDFEMRVAPEKMTRLSKKMDSE